MTACPDPGETVIGPAYQTFAGGKGANQALAAARAGACTQMIGAIGRDGFADLALAPLVQAGVDVSCVKRTDAPTGVALIAVAQGGDNQIVVAAGANAAITDSDVPETCFSADSIAVLQQEVPAVANLAFARRVKAGGGRVILNAAPAATVSADLLRHLDYLIVNEKEAAQVLAMDDAGANTPGTILQYAARAATGHGLGIVVTLGGDGAALLLPGGQGWRVPAMPVAIVDTTGAGDAFIGAFAAALDAGHPPQTALARACIAGGLACTRLGAQSALPTDAEIDAAFDSAATPHPITVNGA